MTDGPACTINKEDQKGLKEIYQNIEKVKDDIESQGKTQKAIKKANQMKTCDPKNVKIYENAERVLRS